VSSFFFSSRRRHTSFSRDWSSDVCSSDLCSSRPITSGSPPEASMARRAFRAADAFARRLSTSDHSIPPWRWGFLSKRAFKICSRSVSFIAPLPPEFEELPHLGAEPGLLLVFQQVQVKQRSEEHTSELQSR